MVDYSDVDRGNFNIRIRVSGANSSHNFRTAAEMKAIAYTRSPDQDARNQFQDGIAEMFSDMDRDYEFDGLAGQRGLDATLKNAGMPGVSVVAVHHFSDLGRDINSAIRNATHLLFECSVEIYIFTDGLRIVPNKGNHLAHLILKLNEALSYYATTNRAIGVATAKAAGAQIGRPTTFTYAGAPEVITRLMDAKNGELPSVRDLAKAVGCGRTLAGKFLKQFKEETQP